MSSSMARRCDWRVRPDYCNTAYMPRKQPRYRTFEPLWRRSPVHFPSPSTAATTPPPAGGRLAVTTGLDTTARSWDLTEGRQIACFTEHENEVRACWDVLGSYGMLRVQSGRTAEEPRTMVVGRHYPHASACAMPSAPACHRSPPFPMCHFSIAVCQPIVSALGNPLSRARPALT